MYYLTNNLPITLIQYSTDMGINYNKETIPNVSEQIKLNVYEEVKKINPLIDKNSVYKRVDLILKEV